MYIYMYIVLVSDTDTELGIPWIKIPLRRFWDFEKFNGSNVKFRKLTEMSDHVCTKMAKNRSSFT